MRISRVLFSAVAYIALQAAASASTSSGDALIDRVIKQPGQYDQMCDPIPAVDPRVPLPLFRLLLPRDLHVVPEQLTTLRAHRDEVVKALRGRLAAMDLSKPVPSAGELEVGNEESVVHSGVHPHQLSGLLFEIIVGLDAVETLPELLKLEEQLRSLLAAADANPKNPPPPLRLEVEPTVPEGKAAPSKRDQQMETGRIVQRELLSVMLQLLRRQHYQPVLDSSFEKQYAKAIKERAKREDLRPFKTPEQAKAQDAAWVHFDPIYHVPLAEMTPPPSVPFSGAVRDQIRGFAEKFLKEVPPDQWKVNADS